MTFKEIEKKHSIMTDLRIKCKCGHSVFIPLQLDRKLCNWCGNFVYKDKKEQFKYELMKELRTEVGE